IAKPSHYPFRRRHQPMASDSLHSNLFQYQRICSCASSSLFFAASGALTGFVNVTATDELGNLLYEKAKPINSSRVVDVMSISPNWYSLNCNISPSTGL